MRLHTPICTLKFLLSEKALGFNYGISSLKAALGNQALDTCRFNFDPVLTDVATTMSAARLVENGQLLWALWKKHSDFFIQSELVLISVVHCWLTTRQSWRPPEEFSPSNLATRPCSMSWTARPLYPLLSTSPWHHHKSWLLPLLSSPVAISASHPMPQLLSGTPQSVVNKSNSTWLVSKTNEAYVNSFVHQKQCLPSNT